MTNQPNISNKKGDIAIAAISLFQGDYYRSELRDNDTIWWNSDDHGEEDDLLPALTNAAYIEACRLNENLVDILSDAVLLELETCPYCDQDIELDVHDACTVAARFDRQGESS